MDRLRQSGLASYVVFGRYDVVCKYYTSPQVTLVLGLADVGVEGDLCDDIHPFGVDQIDLMYGQQISLDLVDSPELNETDIRSIAVLQKDWNQLPEVQRAKLIERGLILPDPVVHGHWRQED